MRSWNAPLALVVAVAVGPAYAQRADPARVAAGQSCTAITQANADASAGTVNINHDGTPIAGTPAPDISRGFRGIPRSAQPRLTASQQRILECTHRVAEANADIPYALFVPSTYHPQKPAPLVVDLHGLNITPLQQILFDGTTDFAERHGFIVVAPMGFNLSSWWGSRPGTPVTTAAVKPGGDAPYSTTELAEIDTMALLKSIREQYAVDSDRHSTHRALHGWCGHVHTWRQPNDISTRLAPSRRRGHHRRRHGTIQVTADPHHARREGRRLCRRRPRVGLRPRRRPSVRPASTRVPDPEHEFWIRRGAAQVEKVSLFLAWFRSGPPSSHRSSCLCFPEVAWRRSMPLTRFPEHFPR